MKASSFRLSLSLLLVALALLAFFWAGIVGGSLRFLYRDVAGLSTVRNVAQWAGWLAAAGLFVAAVDFAVPAALRPAGFGRRLLNALPLWTLLFLLAGVVANALGIGSIGGFLNSALLGRLTFATTWLVAAALLSTVTAVVASALPGIGAGTYRSATTALGITLVPLAVAWLAVVISVVIVMTSQPSAGPGGRGANGPQEGAPATQRAEPAGGEQGGPPPGGGGPGEVNSGQPVAGIVTRYAGGAAVMTLFVALAVVSVAGQRRGLRRAAAAGAQVMGGAPTAYARGIGPALLACVVIAAVVGLAIQLVPVARMNPPVRSTVQWDSPQTKALAYRACMDCHSNETVWPWYDTLAPASWLTASHVNSGRQELNLSQLDTMPAQRKSFLGERIAESVRSGSMPLQDYILIHPEARLTAAEKEQLIQGFQNSLSK